MFHEQPTKDAGREIAESVTGPKNLDNVTARDSQENLFERPRSPAVSIVVPCFNEAFSLDPLITQLILTVEALSKQWEIVLVDDGSSDETWSILVRWSCHPGVRAIQLARNFGKEAAITAGLQAARGDVVVLMDADLQHDPDVIPILLQKWKEGADVAYACTHASGRRRIIQTSGCEGVLCVTGYGRSFSCTGQCRRFSSDGSGGC